MDAEAKKYLMRPWFFTTDGQNACVEDGNCGVLIEFHSGCQSVTVPFRDLAQHIVDAHELWRQIALVKASAASPICGAVNANLFMCDLPPGHDGDHEVHIGMLKVGCQWAQEQRKESENGL